MRWLYDRKEIATVSGKQMVKVFGKIGYKVERQKGSHIVMSKEDIILVIPDHNTISKGTERDLIKDAGLTVEQFNGLYYSASII